MNNNYYLAYMYVCIKNTKNRERGLKRDIIDLVKYKID